MNLGSESTAMEFLKLQLESYLEVWKFCTVILRGKMENMKKTEKIAKTAVFKKLFSEHLGGLIG